MTYSMSEMAVETQQCILCVCVCMCVCVGVVQYLLSRRTQH